ncbi:efflux RND transporter periplasmic adaptor subunit [Vibrio gallicus]|uniref:efflux RND transporter periplasmic adaptor subunit n=1 Tax=Vibrio gallicus TaxID=190897 RepID=UPI0021C4A8E6|nr:efflux RND transporter periplasmic adaptor subunit [Vibrio gallicus]
MRLHWIALSVCALGISACSKEKDTIPEPESRPAKFFTVSVGDKPFERVFPATSSAGDRAVLAFRVPGELIDLPVNAGQQVRQGEVLARLDDEEYKLLRSQAKANFTLANVQFKRMQTLIKDKVVSEQEFDQAVANQKSARAAFEQADANYSYAKLIAPFEGTISIINIDNFEYVSAKHGVMNIQSDALLKVIFQLPDSLFSRFSNSGGVHSKMVFDSFPDREFPLTFQEIDTESDPATGSYKVTMIMQRPKDIGILPGMSGHIHTLIPRSSASVLPTTSLYQCGEKQCVWRIDEQSQVEQVAVSTDDKGAVTSGLLDGDQIVVSGVTELESGMKVREWIKERGL